MPDTELEVGTWTKLALIAQRAREEPQCQFTSLAHLLDERFLAACYHRLGRDRASGVDGVTWKEYGEHLDENLRDLVTRMKAKRYKPLPAKLTGHYQYYGISGNMRLLSRYYWRAIELAMKWLNRRSQKRSFSWESFEAYLKHYPLPTPRIVHKLNTLSPVR